MKGRVREFMRAWVESVVQMRFCLLSAGNTCGYFRLQAFACRKATVGNENFIRNYKERISNIFVQVLQQMKHISTEKINLILLSFSLDRLYLLYPINTKINYKFSTHVDTSHKQNTTRQLLDCGNQMINCVSMSVH